MPIRLPAAIAAGMLALCAGSTAHAAHAGLSAAQGRALLASLHFQHGHVAIAGTHATLDLGPGFGYLDGPDARKVITRLWDNPPHPEVLGMIVPGQGPAALVDPNGYAVVVSYVDDGYVSDADAAHIDFTDMLHSMQKRDEADNRKRVKAGYAPLHLVGWAEPPHYDNRAHKLYWARDLAFGDSKVDSLNYDIRVLGRHGYLSLNAVSDMRHLDSVKQAMRTVLPMARFEHGARYDDFDASTDHVAAYGIGALIAGTLAAKAGLFAKLFALLLVAKKFIIAGLAAVAAFARKLFGRRKA